MALFFSIFPLKIFAENDNHSKLDSLNSQIEILSHDLDYLRLTYEIYALNTDLKILTMEIGNQIKDIKMSIYHRDFDWKMYKQYKELYNAYQKNLISTKELIAAKQQYFLVKALSSNLTENEKSLLSRSHGMTEGIYNQAELSIEMMKSALDIYYKYM